MKYIDMIIKYINDMHLIVRLHKNIICINRTLLNDVLSLISWNWRYILRGATLQVYEMNNIINNFLHIYVSIVKIQDSYNPKEEWLRAGHWATPNEHKAVIHEKFTRLFSVYVIRIIHERFTN